MKTKNKVYLDIGLANVEIIAKGKLVQITTDEESIIVLTKEALLEMLIDLRDFERQIEKVPPYLG